MTLVPKPPAQMNLVELLDYTILHEITCVCKFCLEFDRKYEEKHGKRGEVT